MFTTAPGNTFPTISVLVAARNEEANIAACLDALLMQDYPGNRFEMWVVNNGSANKTADIVQQYVKEYTNFHLLNITSQLRRPKGKANVMVQLAEDVSTTRMYTKCRFHQF